MGNVLADDLLVPLIPLHISMGNLWPAWGQGMGNALEDNLLVPLIPLRISMGKLGKCCRDGTMVMSRSFRCSTSRAARRLLDNKACYM